MSATITEAKQTVTLFDQDGEVKHYRKLSAQLPGFLAKYPPEQGYAVVIEAMDGLAARPGLLSLYRAAIRLGKKPEDVGLPRVAATDMVFQARLMSPEGRVLATASAAKEVLLYKDREVGETAARQRLLAALGFGGEVLDEDEALDQKAMGLTPIVTHPRPPAEPDPVVETDPVTASSAAPVAAAASGAHGSRPRRRQSVSTEGMPPASAGGPASEVIPAALCRQIAHLARVKSKEAPVYQTLQEAREALKALMAA